MSTVTLEGNPLHVEGHFPEPGEKLHSFMLVDKDLNDVSLSHFKGKRKIISIVPSLDTPTCAQSTRVFNEKAAALPNTVVIVISSDLPFAQSRFCSTEGIENLVTLSTLRGRDFHRDYGVLITEHPLTGLTARAVIVADENDIVLHSQLVAEIADEPNYDMALSVLK